jgi:opacity protein-like surface antigen
MQFNPTIAGLTSRAYNGGGGAVQMNFLHLFGIKADFQGYGSTQFSLTTTSTITTPLGNIPPGTFKSNANMFTYMFGPVIRIPAHVLTLSGEVLFGQSNTNGYASLITNIDAGGGTIKASGTQHPFTMAVGGGLDYNVNKRFAIRLAELDYILSRYTNPLTNTNNQNSFRYVGGVVFKFGE